MSGKAKRRTRKPPRRLSAAEIAEIDGLVDGTAASRTAAEHEPTCAVIRTVLDKLVRASPATPWPTHVGRRPVSGRDGFLYVREADGPIGDAVHASRCAPHGMIRYALAPGNIDSHTGARPGWQFMHRACARRRSDDFDRVHDEAVDDLLDATSR